MATFTQRLGKFNFKQLTEVNTTSTINLLYYKGWDKISEILKEFSALENDMHGYHAGVVYGKPNSILRECENSPGVWVFDFSNGITLFMFSDGFRKDHYKGTSYEVELKDDIKEEDVIESLKLFFNDFQKKFKEQYPEDFEKFKMFSNKFKK